VTLPWIQKRRVVRRRGGPIAPRRLSPASPNRIVFAWPFSLGRARVAGRTVALGRAGESERDARASRSILPDVRRGYPRRRTPNDCGAIPETNSKHDGFTRSNRRCFNEKVAGRFASVVDEWGLLVCPAGVRSRHQPWPRTGSCHSTKPTETAPLLTAPASHDAFLESRHLA
jgi:hypothetical protein